MSRKAYCLKCGIELESDEAQEWGYCFECLEEIDQENTEQDREEEYDCDMDIERQKLEELEHPDEKGREGKTIND